MKKIHALALAALLALSTSAFANTKSCDVKDKELCKTECKDASKKECCKDAAKCEKEAEKSCKKHDA
ncbi:MAG TPA: hypothetical protein VF698_03915 [Thermoanaerobaculia bacterium]